MPFVKAAASLLAGKMAGSNNKASFVVHTLRFVYVADAGIIAIAWYSAWRNERVEPGSTSFPFPGFKKLSKRFTPDRPEKELPHEKKPNITNSLAGPNKAKAGIGALTGPIGLTGLPQSAAQAKRLQGTAQYMGHPVARWIIPYLSYAKAHGWNGRVESGYRTPAQQMAAATSYGLYHYAGSPLNSNHVGKNFPKGAVDVTEAAKLSEILESISGGSLLKWAGSSDPVHFSHPHNGGY